MGILETLEKNRVPILLAEIGAYLHDLGKATAEFIKNKAKDSGKGDKHASSEWLPKEIPDLLGNIKINFAGREDTLWNFICGHHNKENKGKDEGASKEDEGMNKGDDYRDDENCLNVREIVQLLCASRNGFDGIDSGTDKGSVSPKWAQRIDHIFIANAFGFEYYKINLDKAEDLKHQICESIKKVVNCFQQFQDKSQGIVHFRKNIFDETRDPYSIFLGETRRSANDVTLWDHSYSVATMMKCAMAYLALNPDKPFDPLCTDLQVLCVGVDVLGMLAKGIRIADTIGYWKKIEEAFSAIKEMVEVTYPMGNEIYRDTTGIYFLVATVDLEALKCEIMQKTKEIEPELIPVTVNRQLQVDKKLQCRTKLEESWKDALKKAIPEMRKSILEKVVFPVSSQRFDPGEFSKDIEENRDVCPVCRLRTVNENKDICNVCTERREKRFETWLQFPSNTIWIDEVCDHNDKIALLVGMFKLDDWLNGELIRTLTFIDPPPQNPGIKKEFKKYPSPSRIRRIWETTQKFIESAIKSTIPKELEQRFVSDALRLKRLQFKISPNPCVPNHSTLEVNVDGVKFTLVCVDKDQELFVSVVNLQTLAKFGKTVEEIAKSLEGKKVKIKRESDRRWLEAKLSEVKPAERKHQNYSPCIEIFRFPEQFMVLVPASEALDIAEKIVKEYEIQFSKVMDRLPFHLGIIAFHNRMPLYVVMDTARRLLDKFGSSKSIKVIVEEVSDATQPELGNSKKLTMRVENKREEILEWFFSVVTKDPEVKDIWYPYLRIDGKPSDRKLCFDYTNAGDYVVHVEEIKKGDVLKIEPSYFKLYYIENAADRFRVDEDLRFLNDLHRIQEIRNRLESGIWSVSQLYAFWEVLRKIREYQGEVFEKFLDSSIKNILDVSQNSERFNEIKEAVKNGLFELCLHWNFQVRKIKVGKGNQDESKN
ncbi:CRISPR-associated protein Csx11 [Pseudothermotoga sp. U03pept]|uniref:CRISPR-associated protein Csx11 n=1 Tax=Pseudothermotoga sp. U03pept TaxID=3447012 RepID=UPI003F09F93F